MYVSRSTGPAHIELYVVVGLNQINGSVPTSGSHSYCGDSTFNDLLYSIDISRKPYLKSLPMRIVDVTSSVAYPNQRPRENGFLIQKPQKVIWNGELDWERYGSLFGILNRFEQTSDQAFMLEHGVEHLSFVGDVMDVTQSPYFEYLGDSFHSNIPGDVEYPLLHHNITAPYGNYRVSGINDFGYFQYDDPTPHISYYENMYLPDFDYYEFVQKRAQFIEDSGGEVSVQPTGSSAWETFSRNVVNNSHKSDNYYHIDVRYEYEIIERGNYFGDYEVHSVYQVHLDFSVAFHKALEGSPSLTDWNPISSLTVTLTDNCSVSVTDSYEYRVAYGKRYGVVPYATTGAGLSARILSNGADPTRVVSAFSPPEQTTGIESNLQLFMRQGTQHPHSYVNRCKRSVDINMSAIRPSSFYSASDALHKSIDVLKSNNIENLTQLSGILGLIPDLPGLGRLIAKASRKDPSALIDLVDFVTDAVLAYRFAQRPTALDTEEILSTDFKAEISDLLQLQSFTGYGEFHHTFDDFSPPMGGEGLTTLVTRSKVRLTFDMSNLMATYLVGNSVGLLPTLSNLWAVVPFSFVVDWFTGMSDRLKSVDDQLLWMAVTTQWCLHSYAITYYPTPEELSSYGLVSSSEKPFGLRYYIREFSLCMPKLRDSKYDYLAPDHGPDPIVVGSLVWQSIR